MGPSSERRVCISNASSAASQNDSHGTEGLDESAPASVRLQRDTEESTDFSTELAEIRRLRAARYRASKEAALRPTPRSPRSPNSSGFLLYSSDFSQGNTSESLLSRNSVYEREQEEDGSGVKKENELTSTSRGHSSCECQPPAAELTASGDLSSSSAPPRLGSVAPAVCRELIVIDEDEEGLEDVSILEADGGEKKSKLVSKEKAQQGVSTDALPIWEDHFDLLTWNVNGLDSKALQPRTTAVVDLVAAVRPAVVFLQEVVPQTLALLRRKLGKSYIIFTPSLRNSFAGTGKNSAGAGCTDDRDGTPEITCSRNAAHAFGVDAGENDVGFPYFVVILLCREQMVPLTPEALCEWFPHSSMGRHMLGVVAAPASRPDDRFLLLTSHLESLKTFHVERINQFKRCMRVLTESFALDGGGRNGEAEESRAEIKKEGRADIEKESVVRSRWIAELPSAQARTCESLRACDTKACSPYSDSSRKSLQKKEENVFNIEKTVRTRLAETERRSELDCVEKNLDSMAQGDDEERDATQLERKMTRPGKREKSNAALRELPAFVGIFGGDMNIRDSELQARVPGASEVRGQKRYRSVDSDNREPGSGCSTKQSRRNEQTAADTNTSDSLRIVNNDSLRFPGVQDVWEYLGRPPNAEFTWDMLRNDNEHGRKMRARLRFDRLYWYSAAAQEGEKKLPERYSKRSGLASARPCRKRRSAELEEGAARGQGRSAYRATADSKTVIQAKMVETVAAPHTAGGPCERTSSLGRDEERKVPVVQWTWRPESLQLVGTHRLPSCGRYPSDHFGLLARFTRHFTFEKLPVWNSALGTIP